MPPMPASPPAVTAQRSMALFTFDAYYSLSFDVRKCTNLASIAFFSSLGVLLRYGSGLFFSDYLQSTVRAIERDSSGILFHDLMVNILGSWMMGLFTSFRDELQGFSPALYVGLTTGLCGCATTFSAWTASMVVLAWDFDLGCKLFPFYAVLGNVLGFGLSYSAHSVGEHMATCIRHGRERFCPSARAQEGHLLPPARATSAVSHAAGAAQSSLEACSRTRSHEMADSEFVSPLGDEDASDASKRRTGQAGERAGLERGMMRYFYEADFASGSYEFLRLAAVVLLWSGLTAGYAIAFRLATQPAVRILMLACIIAPVGAWMRYAISFSNKHTPTFPLYTYVCNLLGSVLAILIYVALTKVLPEAEEGMGASDARRMVQLRECLLALSLGFCGNLTTVSSFVHEVSMLWEKASLYEAYVYALTTLVSVHVICLAFLLPFSVHYSDCASGPGIGV